MSHDINIFTILLFFSPRFPKVTLCRFCFNLSEPPLELWKSSIMESKFGDSVEVIIQWSYLALKSVWRSELKLLDYITGVLLKWIKTIALILDLLDSYFWTKFYPHEQCLSNRQNGFLWKLFEDFLKSYQSNIWCLKLGDLLFACVFKT